MSKLYHLYADITFMHYSVYYFHFQTNNIDNKPHGIDNNTYTFFFYSTEASKLKCLILLPDLLLLSYIHSCIHGIMYIINRLDSIKGHKKGVRNNYIVVQIHVILEQRLISLELDLHIYVYFCIYKHQTNYQTD